MFQQRGDVVGVKIELLDERVRLDFFQRERALIGHGVMRKIVRKTDTKTEGRLALDSVWVVMGGEDGAEFRQRPRRSHASTNRFMVEIRRLHETSELRLGLGLGVQIERGLEQNRSAQIVEEAPKEGLLYVPAAQARYLLREDRRGDRVLKKLANLFFVALGFEHRHLTGDNHGDLSDRLHTQATDGLLERGNLDARHVERAIGDAKHMAGDGLIVADDIGQGLGIRAVVAGCEHDLRGHLRQDWQNERPFGDGGEELCPNGLGEELAGWGNGGSAGHGGAKKSDWRAELSSAAWKKRLLKLRCSRVLIGG